MTRFTLSSIAACAALLASPLLPEGGRMWALGAVLLLWGTGLVLGVACIRLNWFGPALCAGRGGNGRVALTFDDGPDPAVTPQLLDLLRELQVKATFFCVGVRVQAAPELARRIVAEGHLIASHSHRHAWWTNFMFGPGFTEELGRAQEAIRRATGVTPLWFRPPMGLTNPHLHAPVARYGMRMAGWSVRSLDRNARDPEAVIGRILRNSKDGAIVLMHDGGVRPEPLLAIVRGAVAGLRARGLEPVRLDDPGL